MFRLTRLTLVSLSLALAPLSLACGGSSAESPSAATSNQATKAPVAVQAHGPVKLIGEALGEVPLRTDQRTEIEKLAADAEARHQGGRDIHATLALAVADQIERGGIDRAALQPQIDAAVASFEKSRGADRAALERLHAILDASQRSALVDAVEDKVHSRMEHHALKAKMEEWATDLKLTDAQKDQIRDILRDKFFEHRGEWKEGRQHGKQVLEAFRGERFVLDEIAPPVDARAKANTMADRVVGIAQAVLPVLTPEQRSLAAAKIRTRAADLGAEEVQ